MTSRLEPEQVDLAELVVALSCALGATVLGAVIGRTRLRDEVVRQLGCSQVEGEDLVDTMIERGLIARREHTGGVVEWVLSGR